MEIPALVEAVAGNGYSAKTGEPLPLRAEGPTADAALQNLKQLIARRLGDGSRIVPVAVVEAKNPWETTAGIFDPDDPEVQAWIQAMAEYREEVENDPDYR